jgi:hypothetical protein
MQGFDPKILLGTYQTLAAENVDFQTMVALTAKP